MNPITDGQQPSWRLWGEEKIDGAINTVYLKKVRYHPSSSVSFEDAEDSISHLEWETVRVRIIKAGTLEKLVESLANDSGELESTYINIFLSTYRSFATPQQVLSLILDRYKQLGNSKNEMSSDMREQHRKTLVQAVMVWLDMHPEDFYDPPQYLNLHSICDFTRDTMPGSMLEFRARHRLDKFLKEDRPKLTSDQHVKALAVQWFLNHNGNGDTSIRPYDFHEVEDSHFARQLTWMDAELFKKLIPHHCLGSVWSNREKAKGWNHSPSTVSATVNQFNAVSLRVISTILSGIELESMERAQIIIKWIDIAQELRFLKNFSSLKAITAALQSNAVYRLQKVWMCVPREKIEVFSELARIFSEDNNQLNCRKLLLKEGSAKFAEAVGDNDRQLQKLMQRQMLNHSVSTMQGTVPYLGTFLTDLTMIDTAIPDFLTEGLINFDKRRKEFEVLAQIKLLQSSANNYSVVPDERFQIWFDAINILDENESYELSCLIEPHLNTNKKFNSFHKSRSVENHLGHRKTNSTSSSSTCSSSSQFYDQQSSDISMNSLQPEVNGELRLSTSFSSLSLPALSQSSPYNEHQQLSTHNSVQAPDFYIIRVSVQQDDRSAQEGLNLYKSIMLCNRDHTRTVIHNAMMKHSISGDPDNYTLSQLLPDGEITFPYSANIYYAINTSYDLNFVLRPRTDLPNTATCQRRKNKALVKRFLYSSAEY